MSESLAHSSEDEEARIITNGISAVTAEERKRERRILAEKKRYERELAAADKKRARELLAQIKWHELQLVRADEMRQMARERLSDISSDIKPTRLMLTEYQEDTDFTSQNTPILTPRERVSAFLVDPRLSTPIEKGKRPRRRLYFSPIFLSTDGELWTIPDHSLIVGKYGKNGQQLTLEERVERYKAVYREKIKGAELPSMEALSIANQRSYGQPYYLETPRLATDDDLIEPLATPVSKLTGKHPQVLQEWSHLLDQMVAA